MGDTQNCQPFPVTKRPKGRSPMAAAEHVNTLHMSPRRHHKAAEARPPGSRGDITRQPRAWGFDSALDSQSCATRRRVLALALSLSLNTSRVLALALALSLNTSRALTQPRPRPNHSNTARRSGLSQSRYHAVGLTHAAGLSDGRAHHTTSPTPCSMAHHRPGTMR
jgi:hypothetical protein